MTLDPPYSWTQPLDAWIERRTNARLCPLWKLPRIELEVTRGCTRQRLRPLEARAFLIGAAPDCDLVLGDPQFPPAFAYLMRDAEGARIHALAPSPLLAVNGTAVDEQRLFHGDIVRTGPYEFRVHVQPEPRATLVRRGVRYRIDLPAGAR